MTLHKGKFNRSFWSCYSSVIFHFTKGCESFLTCSVPVKYNLWWILKLHRFSFCKEKISTKSAASPWCPRLLLQFSHWNPLLLLRRLCVRTVIIDQSEASFTNNWPMRSLHLCSNIITTCPNLLLTMCHRERCHPQIFSSARSSRNSRMTSQSRFNHWALLTASPTITILKRKSKTVFEDVGRRLSSSSLLIVPITWDTLLFFSSNLDFSKDNLSFSDIFYW